MHKYLLAVTALAGADVRDELHDLKREREDMPTDLQVEQGRHLGRDPFGVEERVQAALPAVVTWGQARAERPMRWARSVRPTYAVGLPSQEPRLSTPTPADVVDIRVDHSRSDKQGRIVLPAEFARRIEQEPWCVSARAGLVALEVASSAAGAVQLGSKNRVPIPALRKMCQAVSIVWNPSDEVAVIAPRAFTHAAIRVFSSIVREGS